MTSSFGPMVIIANPRAGRGRVEVALPQIEQILRDEGIGYRIVRTTHPGHATEAARGYAGEEPGRRGQQVVAVGVVDRRAVQVARVRRVGRPGVHPVLPRDDEDVPP